MLPHKQPKGDVYRVALRPDPWQLSERSLLAKQNRYDDPQAVYHVLYASSSEFGCFIETLARFRVPIAQMAKMKEELDQIDCEDDLIPFGHAPEEWAKARVIGCAKLNGSYADICHSEWLAHLRPKMANWCIALGVDELDTSASQRTAPRELTQAISLVVFGNSEKFHGMSLP